MNELRRMLELAGVSLVEAGPHYDTMKHDEYLPDPYDGRYITWMGISGRMVKITPENSEPIWGNIFHDDKIRETAEAIRNSENRVQFNAPLVHLKIIDIDTIQESLVSDVNGESMYDPVIDGNHVFTTGDVDLDRYLLNPDDYIEDEAGYDEEYRAEVKGEMDAMIETAISEKWGDIGKLFIQVRDGNHRRAAAFMAGEPFIWGMVATQGSEDPDTKKYMV